MIFIRRADLADAKIIASLGRVTFTETFGDLFNEPELEDYLLKTFSVEKIFNSLKKQNNIYWIACFNEEPVGYAKIKLDSKVEDIEFKEQIQLQKIYILKQFLDKRIGSELLKQILMSEEVKKSSIVWLVVLHTNERAIIFYEKFGFRKLKKHNQQIGKTIFTYELMVKEI